MKTRMAIWVLAALLALAGPFCAAEDRFGGEGCIELFIEAEEVRASAGGEDNDAAFAGYVDQLFGLDKPNTLRLLAKRLIGESLTGNDRTIYEIVKAQIAEVAAGERESTVFTISAAQLGLKEKYYAADLGLETLLNEQGTAFSTEATDAIKALGRFELKNILHALLIDCPYELYWFDKRIGLVGKTMAASGRWDAEAKEYMLVYSSDITLYFAVAESYSAGSYVVDTDIARTAAEAAENAMGVVDAYADYDDFNKLTAYKDWICGQVRYNSQAVNDDEPYGNPWQLIWVFDGDAETNVVCEGYAKAFQYLCDKSEFREDVTCRIVTGALNNQMHMWNIVQMPNGKNYIADVTNCDENKKGAPDKLFLRGCPSGSAREGYVFALRSEITYVYGDVMFDYYFEPELTLSEGDYLWDTGQVLVNKEAFPDGLFRDFAAQYDLDGNGRLNPEERFAVTQMDVGGKGIGNLTGIAFFPWLTRLDCSGNGLRELDLSGLEALTWLDCGGNGLRKLNVSGLAALEYLNCGHNDLASLDLDGLEALETLRCQANGLRELNIVGCPALVALAVPENLSVAGADCAEYSAQDGGFLSYDYGVRLIRSSRVYSVLSLPEGLTQIEAEAFANTAAEIVAIPEGCESIGENAFADCPNLVEVHIPDGIPADAVADSAFAGSPWASIVTSSESLRTWALEHGMLWLAEE